MTQSYGLPKRRSREQKDSVLQFKRHVDFLASRPEARQRFPVRYLWIYSPCGERSGQCGTHPDDILTRFPVINVNVTRGGTDSRQYRPPPPPSGRLPPRPNRRAAAPVRSRAPARGATRGRRSAARKSDSDARGGGRPPTAGVIDPRAAPPCLKRPPIHPVHLPAAPMCGRDRATRTDLGLGRPADPHS